MPNRTEHLSCQLDLGRLESAGRIVTYSGWTIELTCCPFDGCVSGFRWTEESGWEPVFVWRLGAAGDAMIVDLTGSARGTLFLADEIAFELVCYFEERRRQG